MLELSDLSGLKKNSMWLLRSRSAVLLRQEGATHTGFIVWGEEHLPLGRCSTSALPRVWESEAGTFRVGAGQSFFHQAICLYSGPQVSEHKRAGRGKGIPAGLAYGEVVGQTVHAGAICYFF